MDEKSVGTSDLRILVDGSDKKIFLKDRHGLEHRLNSLDLSDILEFEDRIGVSLFEIAKANLKLQHITFLLHLSLRKEALSLDDIDKRRWKYTERQVQTMFDLKFLHNSVSVFTDLLSISGFTLGVLSNPPMTQPNTDTTPESV